VRVHDRQVQIDRNGLEVLDRAECLRLLGLATIGRMGLSSGALPTVLPVNFRLVGDRVLVRTGRGSKLDAATRNAVVAFEVDDIDPMEHTGWSVVVTGVAREVDLAEIHPDELVRLTRWAPGEDGLVVAISTDVVSGRRILAGKPTAGTPVAGPLAEA
jgi:nitroimidazol reductase NimA-like FMN-containing flavoprotein (pyridoxamine 5'-phosphate oxidase superfamily)